MNRTIHNTIFQSLEMEPIIYINKDTYEQKKKEDVIDEDEDEVVIDDDEDEVVIDDDEVVIDEEDVVIDNVEDVIDDVEVVIDDVEVVIDEEDVVIDDAEVVIDDAEVVIDDDEVVDDEDIVNDSFVNDSSVIGGIYDKRMTMKHKMVNILPYRINVYSHIKRVLLGRYLEHKCLIENYIYNFQSNSDITEIFPHLYVGNYSTSTNKKILLEKNITHIITISPAFMPPFPKLFQYSYIDAFDDDYEDLTYKYIESNTFIKDALNNNGNVFVHCINGNSLSIAIILSYLVYSKYENTVSYTKKNDDTMYQNIGEQQQHGLTDQELIDINHNLLLYSNDDYHSLLKSHPTYSQVHPTLLLELLDISIIKKNVDMRENFILQLHNCIQIIQKKNCV